MGLIKWVDTHMKHKCVCPSFVGYKSRSLAKGYGTKHGVMGTTPGIHENWGYHNETWRT
jgi:hypothetical protein